VRCDRDIGKDLPPGGRQQVASPLAGGRVSGPGPSRYTDYRGVRMFEVRVHGRDARAVTGTAQLLVSAAEVAGKPGLILGRSPAAGSRP
jgi:hypothetical protein